MNSYNLLINGSWFYFIILAILAIALSIFAYSRTIPVISNFKKKILVSLRSLGLLLLLIILFEPVFKTQFVKEYPPSVSVLFDNSKSMKEMENHKSKFDLYLSAVENSNIQNFDDKIISSFGFNVNDLNIANSENPFDSLLFNEEKTDLDLAFRNKSNINENIQAKIIITDGNFNSGKNPIYEAEKSSIPIYTVGIGDTSLVQDIIVENIITNEIAYLNNPIPVNVNFSTKGYNNDSLELILKENGIELARQMIYTNNSRNDYSALFEYLPKKSGDRKLEAIIKPLENEINKKNNKTSAFVKILENKKQISIFAAAPSPDVSFISKSLADVEGIKLNKYIQKAGANFYITPNQKSFAETDVFVLIGFPNVYTPANILNSIKTELSKGKSLLLISAFNTDYSNLNILKEYLPFDVVSNNNREYQATAILNERELTHPSIRIKGDGSEESLWNNLPPIFRTEIFTKPKPNSKTLMSFKVNNVVLNEPLILSNKTSNNRVMAVLAYGLFRWKLMEKGRNEAKGNYTDFNLYDHFIQNSIKWLSVNEKNKQVNIKTNKKRYTSSEKVQIIAQIYDEAYNTLDDAEVNVRLKSKEDDRDLVLNSIGNGRYIANLEGLSSGDYTFEGIVKFNGKNLGKDQGRFDVGEINLEYTEMGMNIHLLKEIANSTGGKFYYNNNTESLLDDIQSHKNFEPKSKTISSEIAIWNLPYLLILSIIAFSLEWFIRKKTGMV